MARKKKEKKNKKEPKVEKVFGDKNEQVENVPDNAEVPVDEQQTSDIDDFLGKETPEDNLTEKQKKKLEKLNNVKNKISKILKSSNIEIIDENFDDDYDYGTTENVDGQSQQDYDSLKALFGGKDKNKKDELTLTIDDFDYTYIGQYLEEYDLMHLKNIKKVKIQRKRNPKLKKFLIISSLVIVIAVGSVLGFLFTREQPVYLKSVSLSQSERTFFVNDPFEETGIYYLAEYSNGVIKKVPLEMSHFNGELSTGKFSKTGENEDDFTIEFESTGTANLVFTYEGFNVTYVVTVTRKTEVGIHALYNQSIFSKKSGDVIDSKILRLYIQYEEFEKPVRVDMSNAFKLLIGDKEYSYFNGGYTIDQDIAPDKSIKIRYGSFEIELNQNETFV